MVEKWTAITPYRDWAALEVEWTANNGASARKEFPAAQGRKAANTNRRKGAARISGPR